MTAARLGLSLNPGQQLGTWDSVPVVPGTSRLVVAKKLDSFPTPESAERAAQGMLGELRRGPIAIVATPIPGFPGEHRYDLVRLKVEGSPIPFKKENLAYATESGAPRLVQKEISLPPGVHAVVAQDGSIVRPDGEDAFETAAAVAADMAGGGNVYSMRAAAHTAAMQRQWTVTAASPLVAGLTQPKR